MASPSSPDAGEATSVARPKLTTEVRTSDWPIQAADTIERVVGGVRDKTTGPAITIARWIVYGTFAAVVGTTVAVLLIVGAVRALDVYLPDEVFGEEHTWVAHLILGLLFSVVGMVAWSQRSGPDQFD